MIMTAAGSDPSEWLDSISLGFSGAAALGGVAAVIIAVRALTVSRASAAVELLVAASGDVLAALQEVGRVGGELGIVTDGASRSRAEVGESFHRFIAARARLDLALEALDLQGDYPTAVLDVAHNLAADVLQSDEGSVSDSGFVAMDLEDRSWVGGLSWTPRAEEVISLGRSASFRSLRHTLELVPKGVKPLERLDWWWAERVLDAVEQEWAQNVYSPDQPYLIQHARLVDDFAREHVQPMLGAAVRRVVGIRRAPWAKGLPRIKL